MLGDVEASRIANRMLALQEIIFTRDGAGQVLQIGGHSIFAVFDTASATLNRRLELNNSMANLNLSITVRFAAQDSLSPQKN